MLYNILALLLILEDTLSFSLWSMTLPFSLCSDYVVKYSLGVPFLCVCGRSEGGCCTAVVDLSSQTQAPQ